MIKMSLLIPDYLWLEMVLYSRLLYHHLFYSFISILFEWMNEWMDGWMDEWMNEWMNEWINEWMNEWMNEFISH